jgi:hypothetical protein
MASEIQSVIRSNNQIKEFIVSEATQYLFSYKELTELMVKKQGLHEGLWAVYVKFGINAGNISFGGEEHLPTAIIPIMEIGIQRHDKPSALTVDAALVNPSSTKPNKKASKQTIGQQKGDHAVT